MEQAMIQIDHFTKKYGINKGVFDVNLQIGKGEVYGYLGVNGAGKSTTMRHLMGFSKPSSGVLKIAGYDCWKEQKKIQPLVGYLPGEIAFPEDMTGIAYLELIGNIRKMKDVSYRTQLIEYFDIDTKVKLKKMSKGMKQKIGIIAAFMHNPKVLLLDEPTSGLDPYMQKQFIQLVEAEKEKGKTILLSSHIFEEIEKTCDRIGMIRNGVFQREFIMSDLRHSQYKTYKIELKDENSLCKLREIYPNAKISFEKKQIVLSICDAEINELIQVLSHCEIQFLKEEKHTLEEYFMEYYGGEKND